MGGMRLREIERGGTYRVEVPHQMPESRYPMPKGEAATQATIGAWWRLITLRGKQFTLTVVDIDEKASPPTVQGLRTLTHSQVSITLNDDQAADLGLPLPGTYVVEGIVRNVDGRSVEVPDIEELEVPARWLRPVDSAPSRNHYDITGSDW